MANNQPIFSLKSLIKMSNTYIIPRVKRHYHILTNPQTHKLNTKPNHQPTNQIPSLTTNPQTHKPNTKPNHQPTNTQTKYQT